MKVSTGSGLALCAALAACGGESGTGAKQPARGEIASMPPLPSAAPKAASPDAAPAPKDPKTICAGAAEVKERARPTTPGGKQSSGSRFLDDPRERSLSKAKGTYGMADLDALAKKGAWEELLEHAEDVSPASRSAAWTKVVEQAGIGYMTMLTTKTGAYEAVWTSETLLRRYPHLSASTAFMTKRGEAGKVASADCLRNAYQGQHCIDRMKDFLQVKSTSADVGFDFGKIARKNQNHYVAVPFFEWALEKNADPSQCADEDLDMAVVAGLGLPPDYENAAGARKIASGVCWAKLQKSIETHLTASPTSYYRDNACAVLKQKGAL